MRHARLKAASLPRAGYPLLAGADAYLAGITDVRLRRLRYLTKPLLMPTLTTALLGATRGRQDALRNGTVAAQGFSWGGDVALLGESERAFLIGVGSFYGAHVAYIAGFLSVRSPIGIGAALRRPGPRAAAASWLLLAPVMTVAAGRKDPRFRLPIAAYTAALSKMFGTSTLLSPALPASARRMIMAGTALFLASDTALGAREFVLTQHPAWLDRLVMVAYTGGQWLISEGVARAR